jgi:formiminotetrahydrofolate cyclodeaminase
MDFVNEITTLDPVPAGGAAAAYTAGLGMALIYKVILFELNRKNLDPNTHGTLVMAQKEVERLSHDLKNLLREDSQHYLDFARQRRLGDDSEGKSAFLNVLTCSLKVMEKADLGLDWVKNLSKLANPKLLPHLRVAAELLAAGMAGTSHVVRSNVRPMKSNEKRTRYLENVEDLLEHGMARKKQIIEELEVLA